MNIINPEQYLEEAGIRGGEFLASKGYYFNLETNTPIGTNEKFTYGLPRRRSKRTEALILSAHDSDANVTHCFISSAISDSEEVVGLVIRCLLQIATGAINKPTRAYVAAALNLGFGGEKDMLHPIAGGELSQVIAEIVAELGEYPHAATGAEYKPAPGVLFKLQCENEKCKGRKKSRLPNVRVSNAWALSGWTCAFCHVKLTVYSPEGDVIS